MTAPREGGLAAGPRRGRRRRPVRPQVPRRRAGPEGAGRRGRRRRDRPRARAAGARARDRRRWTRRSPHRARRRDPGAAPRERRANLGLDFLPGSLPFTPAGRRQPDPDCRRRRLVRRADRPTSTARRATPTCSSWHRRTWLIDHGAAFFSPARRRAAGRSAAGPLPPHPRPRADRGGRIDRRRRPAPRPAAARRSRPRSRRRPDGRARRRTPPLLRGVPGRTPDRAARLRDRGREVPPQRIPVHDPRGRPTRRAGRVHQRRRGPVLRQPASWARGSKLDHSRWRLAPGIDPADDPARTSTRSRRSSTATRPGGPVAQLPPSERFGLGRRDLLDRAPASEVHTGLTDDPAGTLRRCSTRCQRCNRSARSDERDRTRGLARPPPAGSARRSPGVRPTGGPGRGPLCRRAPTRPGGPPTSSPATDTWSSALTSPTLTRPGDGRRGGRPPRRGSTGWSTTPGSGRPTHHHTSTTSGAGSGSGRSHQPTGAANVTRACDKAHDRRRTGRRDRQRRLARSVRGEPEHPATGPASGPIAPGVAGPRAGPARDDRQRRRPRVRSRPTWPLPSCPRSRARPPRREPAGPTFDARGDRRRGRAPGLARGQTGQRLGARRQRRAYLRHVEARRPRPGRDLTKSLRPAADLSGRRRIAEATMEAWRFR